MSVENQRYNLATVELHIAGSPLDLMRQQPSHLLFGARVFALYRVGKLSTILRFGLRFQWTG